ncbi:MAG: fibronectin type III domain-containing protein [Candidatus Brocadiia bacterium]
MPYNRQSRSVTGRSFRILLAALLTGVLLWTAGAPLAWAGFDGGTLNIHATFSGDPRHEVTVSWRTEEPLVAPAVRYGQADTPEGEWSRADGAETVESAGGFNHHVALKGLEPATRYRYRVAAPETGWGPVCGFRTAPEGREPFTFAVVGDVQGWARPSARWQRLGRWVAEQDVAFLLLLGDLVQTGSEQPQWNAFFNCAAPESDRSLFHSTIVMPLLGNHDHQVSDELEKAGDTQAGVRLYLDQFRLPPNGFDEVLDGRTYTFTYGDARFVILDTSGHGPDGPTHARQTRWLASLDLEDRPWVLAAHHVPVVRFLNHVPSHAARNVWRPHFYRHYMDIVFNGHNHSHAVSWPLEGVELHGTDGGRGFAGPWEARTDRDSESGMDSLFLLEENELVRYAGYESVGRSVRTVPLGTHEGIVSDAKRPLKPIDTSEKRELWMGYVYGKMGKYYGGGGWQLTDSSRPDQFIRVGATRVMDEGRHGHFQVVLADESAVAAEPIIEEGKVPEEPFFVLAKFVFEDDRAVAHLKSYRSPETLPAREPEDWNAVLEVEGDWALKLDTLTHRGERDNRLALVDEFRVGERMADVLLVPEGRTAKRAPLAEERFDLAPTIDREHGVVYYDGGGVNSSGPARDAWFVRFRENASRMPLVGMVTVTGERLRVRTVFYDDFGDQYRAGEVFNEFVLRNPGRGKPGG